MRFFVIMDGAYQRLRRHATTAVQREMPRHSYIAAMAAHTETERVGPLQRLYDALIDPARAERTALAILVAFTVLWTAYGTLSSAYTDVHRDIGELVDWSRTMAWGYKHPPMSAWIARAWFTVMPLADWSAFLLGTLTSASALWIAWRLFAEWLDAERRVLGLAMLMLTPLYTFHAIKFNANTVMIPFWALTALYFLRSVTRRTATASAATGLAGAGAMLGKYWSVNLLGGLGLAALLDRRRMAYLRSPAPWIALAVLALTLAPHAIWLTTRGSAATGFSQSIMVISAARSRTLEYVGGSLGYIAVPLLLFASLRPTRAALRDTLAPADDDRRLAAMTLWMPLLLPAVLNLLIPTRLTSLWTIPDWTLLPVVLLGSRYLTTSRRVGITALGLSMAIPTLALLATPIVAMAAHRSGALVNESHYRMLGESAERRWHAVSATPLRWIGGDSLLTQGANFYAVDEPRILPVRLSDSTTMDLIRTEGIVLMCRVDELACVASMDTLALRTGAQRKEETHARTYRGVTGKSQRYVFLLVPPHK